VAGLLEFSKLHRAASNIGTRPRASAVISAQRDGILENESSRR
jgi:hypothetical protein